MLNIIDDVILKFTRCIEDELIGKIISRKKIFRGKVTIENRPSSRSNEVNWADHLFNVLSSDSNLFGKGKSFDIKFEFYDTSVNVAIFEYVLESTKKLLLVKFDFHEEMDLLNDCIYNDYLDLYNESIIQKSDYKKLSVSYENLKAENIELKDKISELLISRENLQADLLQKMCILLNSKKREIISLKDCVNELKDDAAIRSIESAGESTIKTKIKRGRKNIANSNPKLIAGIISQQTEEAISGNNIEEFYYCV